jgi:hypothetical protein
MRKAMELPAFKGNCSLSIISHPDEENRVRVHQAPETPRKLLMIEWVSGTRKGDAQPRS